MQKESKGINFKRIFNLNIKMIILISFLITCILLLLGLFLNSFITNTIEDQIGKRALSVATSVANMDGIIEAFEADDPAIRIQEIVQPIRQSTNAEYIVVGNTEGTRYSHPLEDRIGQKMVGGDNERALIHGESYITKQTGSLGLAVRGKVPIKNHNGDIIGVVSVGFLSKNIEAIINDEKLTIWLVITSVFLLGIIGAITISSYIKRLLFHMEPEEISQLLLQKEAILQSTKEGIIAMNQTGETTMINKAARDILSTDKDLDDINLYYLFNKLENDSGSDVEMVIGENVILVNRTPMIEKEETVGIVATLRRKTEVEHITKELIQIKQYANALRSQSHEFSNKLYTVLGLLQLNKVDQAIKFLQQESDIHQQLRTFLTEHVADPMIHGLLQGKHNQANELGITFYIHEDSQLERALEGSKQAALLTSLGNVIENAIESIKSSRPVHKEIAIYFSDGGNDIVFEIEDSGTGLTDEASKRLFEQGFSTKQTVGRGTGLALTKQVLNKVNGEIMYENSNLGGALFVIVIPKDEV